MSESPEQSDFAKLKRRFDELQAEAERLQQEIESMLDAGRQITAEEKGSVDAVDGMDGERR